MKILLLYELLYLLVLGVELNACPIVRNYSMVLIYLMIFSRVKKPKFILSKYISCGVHRVLWSIFYFLVDPATIG